MIKLLNARFSATLPDWAELLAKEQKLLPLEMEFSDFLSSADSGLLLTSLIIVLVCSLSIIQLSNAFPSCILENFLMTWHVVPAGTCKDMITNVVSLPFQRNGHAALFH